MADGIAARLNGPVYTAQDERLLDAVLLMPDGPLQARQGRRPGGGLSVSVGGTPEAAIVEPGVGVVNIGTVNGSYRFAIPNQVTVPLGARPGAGTSRIDLVVVRMYDADITSLGTLLREVEVEVITGTAAASPSTPSQPAGCMRLASLTVPASGTVAVSQAGSTTPRTVASGGILPVTGTGERDNITAYDGLMIYREDTDTYEGRVDGAWATLVTAGAWANLSLSAQSGWSIGAARYRLNGDLVHLDLSINRTGSDITFNSSNGNIGDLTMATGLLSAIRPSVRDVPAFAGWGRGLSATVYVETGGAIVLSDGTPGATITSAAPVLLRATYMRG